jgi:hypothetical protein
LKKIKNSEANSQNNMMAAVQSKSNNKLPATIVVSPGRLVVGIGFDPLASVFIPVARANLWFSRARFSE